MIAEAFSFPEINSILRWKDIFSTFNKVALIAVAAAVIGSLIFILAGRKNALAAPPVCATWPRPRSSSSKTAS